MLLQLRRVIIGPALGPNALSPGGGAGGGSQAAARPPLPPDAAVESDTDYLELVAAGSVWWQYQPQELGTAGPLLPDYLQEEGMLCENQAARLMLKISSLLTGAPGAAAGAQQ